MADILGFGVFIVLTFFLLARWLGWYRRLRLLNRPLVIDVAVTLTVFVLYGGTLTGVMAASFACVVISLLLAQCRKTFGYITSDNKYYVGRINVHDKILEDLNK